MKLGTNSRQTAFSARSTRRKLLGRSAGAGLGLTGLALVGCGGDDDESILATPTAGANPTPTPADPFASAKRGGRFQFDATGDPPSIDPYGNTSFLTKGFAAYAYSRLFKLKAGPGIGAGDVKPVPDIAQSAEASPDGLKWTIKLRPDVKFHNLAPVNGRAVTSDDIKYSWRRATDPKNGNSAQLAFVDKVEYPDAQTAVFTLKTTYAPFLDTLADANLLWIMPTEADGGFRPAEKAIGTGPWVLDNYTVSVSQKWNKNPGWHEKGFPLADGIDVAIIPEAATRLAQFQAGNLDATALGASDLVKVKQQLPNVTFVGLLTEQTSYVYFDSEAGSPWRDERVRQAVSMAIDRDALNDLAFEVTKLKNAGLDVKSLWNNIIPAGMSRFWLDPKSSAHGDTGKYFNRDVAEAKKLISAAGFADGFPAVFQYAGNRYGADFNAIAEATIGFLTDIGVKVTTDVQDYNSVYISQTSVGNFKGIAFGPETPFPEPGGYPIRLFTDNPKNRGKIKDATLEKLARDQQAELNDEKRRQLILDMQKYQAGKMYYIPSQFRAGTVWTGYQPAMKNVDTYRTKGFGAPTETYVYYWKDRP